MKKLLLLLSVLLLSNLFFAQNQNDTLPFDSNVKFGVLDNGMTYYIMHNSEPKNRAYLELAVNAGSVFEDEDQRGLAHMCEHMAFNGTKNFPKKELIKYLESVGMKFGADLNAYTSFDETVYTIEIPLDSAQILDKGLHILYDWATNVSYEDDEIDAERGVIIEEWRLGLGAMERIRRKTFPVLLHNSLYAKRVPIGDTAIIKHCPHDALRRFYKDWYRPDLQAVIVVGDFNADSIEQVVRKMFSKIPARKNPRPHIYPEIPDHKDILCKVATDSELRTSTFTIYIKHDYKPVITYADFKDELVTDLVTEMLNMRMKEEVQKPSSPLLYCGTGYSHFLDDKAIFYLYAIPKNNKSKEAITLTATMLQSAKKFGFTQSEMEMSKKALFNEFKNFYDNRFTTSSERWASLFQQNFDKPKLPVISPDIEYQLYQKMLPSITINDVNNKIKELVTDSNTVLTLVSPENNIPTEDEILKQYKEVIKGDIKPYKSTELNKPLLSNEPKAGKIVKEKKDKVTGSLIWTLSNGIKVIVKPTDFKDNQILLEAFSKGGMSLYTGDDIVNARVCTSIQQNSGLGNYSQTELSKFLADKTVELKPYISLYNEGLSGQSSNDNFEQLLQLVYAQFMQPKFDSTGLKLYLEHSKTLLETKSNDPQAIWRDSLYSTLYGNSPYFNSFTLKTLDKIDLKRTAEIYNERFGDPASFTFVIVGSVNPDSIKPFVEKYIASLPKIKKAERPEMRNISIKTNKNIVAAVKGSDPKSLIYFLMPGKAKNTIENKVYLNALSYVLDDSLIDVIREKKQWTYSISAFDRFKFNTDEYFVGIFYSSVPDIVDSVNNEIMRIVRSVKNYNVSDEQVESTIEKLKKEHEKNLRNNQYWISNLKSMYLYDEKPDFITKYNSVVNSLDSKKIKQIADKLLPDKYVAVVLKPEK